MRLRMPWRCWLAVFGPLAVAGCGGGGVVIKAVPQGEVSGRVLLKGDPLPGGKVFFRTDDGQRWESIVDENGNYRVTLPTGPVKIGVDNRMVNKARRTGAPRGMPQRGAGRPTETTDVNEVKGRLVSIASKYYSPENSGLTYTVEKGTQTHDIPLD